MQWPKAPPVHSPETYDQPPFAKHLYTSTLICHKKKVGQRQQYVRKFKVRLPNGRTQFVLGGTQKVDGYWASLRRFVGKRSVNTGSHPDAHRRLMLKQYVRVHQWCWWHLNVDRFALFADIVSNRRTGIIAPYF